MAVRAVLFDLGNTLVRYYSADEFPSVLHRCLQECAATLASPLNAGTGPDTLFQRALALNREQADYAVRPLADRLQELFEVSRVLDTDVDDRLTRAFLKPILDVAVLDPEAHAVLDSLRRRGIRTAIVSNTPWGSPADLWREELARHGLLQRVDATVFCMDVGCRKPHRAPFDRALSLLGVTPSEAIFVGDDPGWDVAGALNAGLQAVLLGSSAEPSSPRAEVIRRLSDVLRLVGPTDEAPNVTYRSLHANDDLHAITDLLHVAYAPLAAAGMRYVASHQDVATTRRRIAKGETFVAIRDDDVVGIITLAEADATHGSPWYDRPDVASFGQFAVLPDLQRQGIGSRLMDMVEARAREKGVDELALDTSEHAEALIAMYTKRGYRFIEYAQWDVVNYRSVILSKRLR